MTRCLSLIVSSLSLLFGWTDGFTSGAGANSASFIPSRTRTNRNVVLYVTTPRDGTDDDHQRQQVSNSETTSRRRFFTSAVTASALALLGDGEEASAYDRSYPVQLDASDGDLSDERRRRAQKVLNQQESKKRMSLFGTSPISKAFGSFLWAVALWFLTGSRSNPIVTPLANTIYDDKEEGWLKDRNDGLFSDLPLPFFALLAIVFLVLGFGFDSLINVFAAAGDRDLNLQLAGVSLISGGALELGRIASGEKKETREETDRNMQLEQEFQDFATNRLKRGGNVHRAEVVQAFRRYYAKYRQADHPEYGLADIEIERLVRDWSRTMFGIEMSSAGFFSGIQINKDADAFRKM